MPALKEHNIIIDNNKTDINKNKLRKECFKEYKERSDEKNEFYSSPQDLLNKKKTSSAILFHITWIYTNRKYKFSVCTISI